MPQLGERGRGKRHLSDWWEPLVNEPLKPPQRRALVALWIGRREELAQRESVGERQPAHLPRGRFGV